MHPLLNLAIERPQLLADHAQAWADLLGQEWLRMRSDWQRRALWHLLALSAGAVTLVLAGVAVMLCAALPALPPNAGWVLAGTPLPTLVLTVVCLWAARSGADGDALDTLRSQWQADLAMLREAGAA